MPKKPARTGITLTILLEHMRGMERRLFEAINGVRTGLKTEIKGARTELKNEIKRVEVVLSTQIANLDARLDDLEVVQVPRLKKAVGIR